MHNKKDGKYIFKGFIQLLIVLSILYYWYVVRPAKIITICNDKLLRYKEILEQNKEALLRFNKIEREQHQKKLASLSKIEREESSNVYLMEKWDNKNIEKYEKQLEENKKQEQAQYYKNCLRDGGK